MLRFLIGQSVSGPIGSHAGIEPSRKDDEKATAVFGSIERAAPDRFRGRAKAKGVVGQSPLPKTAYLAKYLSPYIGASRFGG